MSDGIAHDPRLASIALLSGLIRRGHALKAQLTQNAQNTQSQVFSEGSADSALNVDSADARIWQRDCAAAINELSGGSKAHWLSRAYSSALLVRSMDGEAVVEADVAKIVQRVLDVLERGRQSLATMDAASPAPAEAQEPHRFDFVHDAQLRPVLEQAFIDGRRAFEAGDYDGSLRTAAGIIEAIITDALDARLKPRAPADSDSDGARGFSRAASFEERIRAAEAAGLIRGGCARLPAVARAYRDADQQAAVTERDAAVTRQVLRVVMRDLDPGR